MKVTHPRNIDKLIRAAQREGRMLDGMKVSPDGTIELKFTRGEGQCHAETMVRGSATAKSGEAITSLGQQTVALASKLQAQQAAKRLKSSLLNGSLSDESQPAQVIPLKAS